jgi:hypothetical protein
MNEELGLDGRTRPVSEPAEEEIVVKNKMNDTPKSPRKKLARGPEPPKNEQTKARTAAVCMGQYSINSQRFPILGEPSMRDASRSRRRPRPRQFSQRVWSPTIRSLDQSTRLGQTVSPNRGRGRERQPAPTARTITTMITARNRPNILAFEGCG